MDEDPPKYGLGAARMAALLTYQSRDSFESRFGRKEQQRRVPSPTTVLKKWHICGLEVGRRRRLYTFESSKQARHANNITTVIGPSGRVPLHLFQPCRRQHTFTIKDPRRPFQRVLKIYKPDRCCPETAHILYTIVSSLSRRQVCIEVRR